MNKIDEKTFDVRPVLILIRHDHETAVAKGFQIGDRAVILAVLETDDPDDVIDLGIVLDLETQIENNQLFIFDVPACESLRER